MTAEEGGVILLAVERERRRDARSLGLGGSDEGITPEDLYALAAKFETEIGGVYCFVAAALRQQAAEIEGRE